MPWHGQWKRVMKVHKGVVPFNGQTERKDSAGFNDPGDDR